MPRRKPQSSKQHKAQMLEKRAVKRGDAPPADPKQKQNRGPNGRTPGRGQAPTSANVESARKLQSDFVKVSAEFLEETKILASSEPLPRPLPASASSLPVDLLCPQDRVGKGATQMNCPQRPKWKFEMTKKEVEKNEEGVFKKWLAHTETVVNESQQEAPTHESQQEQNDDLEDQDALEPAARPALRAPTHFERNLEVWRQLWRVNEISEILLVLLDARCPPLHFPPTLAAYLDGRPVILILTKVDIVGPERAQAWVQYLSERNPGRRIVQVESYTEKAAGAYTQGKSRPGHEPHLPTAFREQLVQQLHEMHEELLQPPEHIRKDVEKAARWRPKVKRAVDWNAVMSAHGDNVGHAVGGAAVPHSSEVTTEGADEREPEYLTIGLIGQPNVGKSSLLNALFGTIKVRASRTPGKTKHFQTLFWTPDVRLVDCPGLVVPNLVPMEAQVLSGILPISRVSAVPACIHFAAKLLPLERIFGLTHPSALEAPAEDKRTWRDGQPRPQAAAQSTVWTAMDILTSYAIKKGWITAKAGRPDINRAGNAILRALAEGKIRWAFWPPEKTGQEVDQGIWIEGDVEDVSGDELSAEEHPLVDNQATTAESTDEEMDDSDDEAQDADAESLDASTHPRSAASRFAALGIDGEVDDETPHAPRAQAGFAALSVDELAEDDEEEHDSLTTSKDEAIM